MWKEERGKGEGEGLSFMARNPRREATRAGAQQRTAAHIICKSPFLPAQLECVTVQRFGGSSARKAGPAAT
jgi:hypothetical protein